MQEMENDWVRVGWEAGRQETEETTGRRAGRGHPGRSDPGITEVAS